MIRSNGWVGVIFYAAAFFILRPTDAFASPHLRNNPQFVATGWAGELNLANWISIYHIGAQDAVPPEYIIAFSSDIARVERSTGTIPSRWAIHIVHLPYREAPSILGYIHDPEHSTPAPIPELKGSGIFQIAVYSHSEATEVYWMTPSQSKQFFVFLGANARGQKGHSASVKKAFDSLEHLGMLPDK